MYWRHHGTHQAVNSTGRAAMLFSSLHSSVPTLRRISAFLGFLVGKDQLPKDFPGFTMLFQHNPCPAARSWRPTLPESTHLASFETNWHLVFLRALRAYCARLLLFTARRALPEGARPLLPHVWTVQRWCLSVGTNVVGHCTAGPGRQRP